jgi:hypothetical protein
MSKRKTNNVISSLGLNNSIKNLNGRQYRNLINHDRSLKLDVTSYSNEVPIFEVDVPEDKLVKVETKKDYVKFTLGGFL